MLRKPRSCCNIVVWPGPDSTSKDHDSPAKHNSGLSLNKASASVTAYQVGKRHSFSVGVLEKYTWMYLFALLRGRKTVWHKMCPCSSKIRCFIWFKYSALRNAWQYITQCCVQWYLGWYSAHQFHKFTDSFIKDYGIKLTKELTEITMH